jgi:hypothetical protein
MVISERLLSDCTPYAQRSYSDSKWWRRIRAAISKLLLSDCSAISKLSRSDFLAIAQRLLSDCTQPLRIVCGVNFRAAF